MVYAGMTNEQGILARGLWPKVVELQQQLHHMQQQRDAQEKRQQQQQPVET